jgi:hypothetical protein
MVMPPHEPEQALRPSSAAKPRKRIGISPRFFLQPLQQGNELPVEECLIWLAVFQTNCRHAKRGQLPEPRPAAFQICSCVVKEDHHWTRANRLGQHRDRLHCFPRPQPDR